MKNLILSLLFVLVSTITFGQTTQKVMIDGVNINEKQDVEYIELLYFQKFMSFKVRCVVDYGQPLEWTSDTRVQTEDGTVQNFNSVIDGLNYFTKNGWEFVSNYPVTVNGTNVYHYLLKRKK